MKKNHCQITHIANTVCACKFTVSVVEVKKNTENDVYVGVYSTQFCQIVLTCC